MPYNTYINPVVRRNLFKEMKRMEERTGNKSKQDQWRGVIAVLNQHNNLMDVKSSHADEGAKISEYYRKHGGVDVRKLANERAKKLDVEVVNLYGVDESLIKEAVDPDDTFLDRHFKKIVVIIGIGLIALSYFVG